MKLKENAKRVRREKRVLTGDGGRKSGDRSG